VVSCRWRRSRRSSRPGASTWVRRRSARETEKEQEDLLVLLDELNSKRRRDKARMREKGLDVSEDEAEDKDE
jgi:hypothetical protein